MANTRNNLILQGFGGPKLVTQGFGPDLAYRTAFYYDRKGNVTCVLDPDNGQTYYTYDKVSRMTSVLNPWGETAYYEYSPGGKLLARTLGNGCVTYYAYDRRGVTKVENLKSDLSVISTFEYTRDRTGNPLSILREDGSCVYYEYDLNQQLTAETQTDDTGAVVYAWEWDYDRAGNRLWQTFNGEATYYEYNACNELVTETTDGATTYYDYDRNGNQTAKQTVDGTTYFHYDFENLLRQIDLPDGAHNYFTYDADSKRVSAQDSTGYTRFIYQGPDMLKLLQEKDAAGNTQAQYTMGMGLESMRRGAASSFFHYDALGSAQELTDAAEAVTDTYRYNAWGVNLGETGSTANPHTYIGLHRYYATAAKTALYALGYRWYDPVGGRFQSVDPAFVALDAFAYVLNRPTKWTDARGLQGGPGEPVGSPFDPIPAPPISPPDTCGVVCLPTVPYGVYGPCQEVCQAFLKWNQRGAEEFDKWVNDVLLPKLKQNLRCSAAIFWQIVKAMAPGQASDYCRKAQQLLGERKNACARERDNCDAECWAECQMSPSPLPPGMNGAPLMVCHVLCMSTRCDVPYAACVAAAYARYAAGMAMCAALNAGSPPPEAFE